METHPIPVIPGVRVLKDRYLVWLCDVWGVVHNGVTAFRPAVDALVRFREAGGRVALLTNAPRPASPIYGQLADIGVPREAFDVVVTSGDATRTFLTGLDGKAVYHLGPERDTPLFADLNLNLTDADRAEVVLCTGLVDDVTEAPEDYRDLLASLAGRDLPLMCANPDIVVDRGGMLVPCAGALGELYASLGGETLYAGKPHRPIYDLAFAEFALILGRPLQRRETLAIGDGLRTDIAGAAAYGIDALFVAGGIHIGEIAGPSGEIEPARLEALFEGTGMHPVAAQRELAW